MKIIWLVGIIVLVGLVVGDLNPNTYRIRSFTIGDGTNSSLAGTTLGNGTFWGTILPTNFIAGENINISQNGTNITITGAATWTLSGLTIEQINGTLPDGYYSDASVPKIYLDDQRGAEASMGFESDENQDGSWIDFFYNGMLSLIAFSQFGTSSINISDNKININSSEINLNGNVNINNKNLEQELVKTSTKSFQAGYLNASAIYSDIIIMPQDLKLTNITSIVEKTNGSDSFQLNFSIEKYTSYPSSKIEIANYSLNQDINYFNSLDYDFSNNDVVLLNYTSYVNVSSSSTMFKFKVR